MGNGKRRNPLSSQKGVDMRTKKMLDKMPEKNRRYLENLREHIRQARMTREDRLVDEFKSVGKGYIKGLVDCGVVEDFKTVWCWFTL